MTHRESIKEHLGQITLNRVVIADWGSGAKPVMRYIKHEDCVFYTIDNNKQIVSDRRSNNHITTDICQTTKLPEKVDVAFCMEVLEHTKNYTAVLKNIYANLKKGGLFYLSTPFLFPIHADEDYWRFTKHGLYLILTSAGFIVDYIEPTESEQGYLARASK